MAYQVLIVDDDPQMREELAECLEGYDIVQAGDGLQALQLFRKPNMIDLVLLDVAMPGMWGTDVLREIKRLKPALPIIMLTGQSSKDVAIESLKAHADDYLEKPFSVDKLLELIQKILSAKSPLPPEHAQGVDGKIARAVYFLKRNFDKKVSLSEMASQLALSPKYFSRMFKKVTGKGFNEFRLKVKTDQAARLLKTTSYTVSELSLRLGYKNTESFVRVFKLFTGKSPQQYRNEARSKGEKRHGP